MNPRSLHQILAGYSKGDAISNEALTIRAIARARGLASEIYCETARVLPELRGDMRDLSRAAAELGPEDAALLHLSIGSPANALFPSLRARKAILYHNITPPEWFEGVRDATARMLAHGREQARALAGTAAVTLADSAYNATELETMGHREVGVFPLALDFSHIRTAPDRGVMREYGDGRLNVLFVGRGVPNKRIEDLLAAFYYLRRYVEPSARLVHVGSYAGCERYLSLLRARTREWKLEDVLFPGSVPQPQLAAYYRRATVFLCMSEHEGFCVPIVEAMAHDVPVLAFAAAAVPETLGGAGVLFHEKRFDLVAEMIARIARDARLRAGILAAQRRRLATFESRDLAAELWLKLGPVLA